MLLSCDLLSSRQKIFLLKGGRKHLFSVDTGPVSLQHSKAACVWGVFCLFVLFSLLLLSVSQLLYCFTNTVLHIPYLPINLSGYIPTCALRCWHLSKIFSNNIFQIKLVFKDIFQTLLIVDDIRHHLSVFFQARSFLAFKFVSSSVNIFLSGTRLRGSENL